MDLNWNYVESPRKTTKDQRKTPRTRKIMEKEIDESVTRRLLG